MKFEAVLFDLVGTTVIEKTNTIIGAFERAFAKNNILVDKDFHISHRGRGKKEIIESLLLSHGIPESATVKVYDDFRNEIESSIHDFSAAPGAEELFSFVSAKGIRLGIGTGLPRGIFELMLGKLNWNSGMFDYTGIAEEIGFGRPEPDMIFDMMKKLNLNDGDKFLKTGDTAADIREGKNAGVKTAVILSGTQDSEMLKNENPDYVIGSLLEIKTILG
jgi:phosphonoacetaldehyde hydrolase